MSHSYEQYKYDFICPCPSINCKSARNIYWTHHNCGGHQKMNDWGYIKCNVCSQTGLICEWLFNCGEHYDGFRIVSGQKIIYVMEIIGQMNALEEKADEIYENYKDEKKEKYIY